MSTVKYFASEVSEEERYSKRLNVLHCQRQVRDDLRNLRHDLYCVAALATLVLFYGGNWFLKSMRAGDLVSFSCTSKVCHPRSAIGTFTVASLVHWARRISFELINRTQLSKGWDSRAKQGRFRGNIEFRDVTFRYPTRKNNVMLKSFDLR